METFRNPVLENLPRHLQKYVVPQDYSRYTAEDQAIWRYVMRQNYAYLKDIAYYPYIPGLRKAGLSIERIPSLQDMNDSLQKIGWGAVTVDGFIPPSAFMEFQANCVLVIAADIRQIDHITYTPAPDIIHESSGHAPIIGEPEYAAYLQYFGEIGSKAMSSGKDFELYEAIRKLSIVKEKDDATEEEIDEATRVFKEVSENMGKPSEMALLSRLHWWTVEYGLIGTLSDYKIYGAGLLSSIGESATCMQEDVAKLPYNMDTINYAYDITKPQPQLFVTPNFEHAYQVLDQFAENMAFRKGGVEGVDLAIDSKNTCTVVYSSGLQVSGVFVPILSSSILEAIKTSGPSALAFKNKELTGHGIQYHRDGFSSPVGSLIGNKKNLEDCSVSDLSDLGVKVGEHATLYFKSGILVAGNVVSFTHREDKLLLITFDDCSVIHEPSSEVLFRPEWGTYDMAVGEYIVSVYAGAADKYAYEDNHKITELKTGKNQMKDPRMDRVFAIYSALRDIREDRPCESTVFEIYEELKNNYPDTWLAMLELYELALHFDFTELAGFAETFLKNLQKENPSLEKLIKDGLYLATHLKINFDLAKQ